MGIVLFLLYLFLCLGAYSLFLILFKNRYTTYYQLDDIIDTNDETYAVYLPENRWKEYIKDYTVYINDEYRFLKFELTDKVQYININIICYRDKKIKRIISFLNEIDVKQEHFIIKLPDNCDEIKLNVVEVNGNPYFEDSNIKCDVLWRSIVSSLILGFSAVLMLFIFRLAAMGFENSYFNWNHIYELFFYEPWTYIVGICFALILAGSLFLILYLSNNLEFKKARFNKIKKLKIDKVLKTKLKIRKKKDFELPYLVFKPKRKRKFKRGEAKVKCFDENNNLLKEIDLTFYKKKTRYWLSSITGTKRVEVNFIGADFKKIYFRNGTFRKKITKKGVQSGFLTLKGIKQARILFIVSILAVSSFSIFKYYELNNINGDLSNFVFDYVEGSQNLLRIKEYKGKSSKVVVPKEFNNMQIVSIDPLAFATNFYIDEVYFTAPIDIGDRAFQNCANLKVVDFSFVSRIGSHAFGGTRIRELIVDHPMIIEDGAFYNNTFFRKIIIEEVGASLLSGAFSNTKTQYFELHQETNLIESGFYSNGEIVKGYVFDTAPINRGNYTGYFSSNTIKVENSCVHDNNSFFVRNGQIIDTKSYTYFATISEPTCITNGLNEVTCNYCGSHYNVFSPSDPNAHNFVDGKCIYCGKDDPNYVFTEDVSERRPA